MEKRYGVLRFIGTIYKLFGVIVLILAVLGALGVCAAGFMGGASLQSSAQAQNLPFLGGALSGIILGILALLYGGAVGLGLIAFGDFISLALSIEENTRVTAGLLRGQSSPAAPNVPH